MRVFLLSILVAALIGCSKSSPKGPQSPAPQTVDETAALAAEIHRLVEAHSLRFEIPKLDTSPRGAVRTILRPELLALFRQLLNLILQYISNCALGGNPGGCDDLVVSIQTVISQIVTALAPPPVVNLPPANPPPEVPPGPGENPDPITPAPEPTPPPTTCMCLLTRDRPAPLGPELYCKGGTDLQECMEQGHGCWTESYPSNGSSGPMVQDGGMGSCLCHSVPGFPPPSDPTCKIRQPGDNLLPPAGT